jgi:hypothetical protein
MRQALRAFLYTVPAVVVAAVVATLVERAGGPDWLTLIIIITPIGLMTGLLQRWSGKAR